MLVFPAIDPVAFSIGPLQVHWYGLMYLLGISAGYFLALWRISRYNLPWTRDETADLIFYCALGIIIGGRAGYMLFYDFPKFIHQPLMFFKLWEGGMSFHGGLLGVSIAAWFFARRYQKTFLQVGDFVAPLVPLGLAAGRAGNFINGELWGRVTSLPWGMVFPLTDGQPRHPSQLYEMGLEGILLFIIVWTYAAKPRVTGAVTGVFLMSYALCRLFIECFREPDPQLGFILFNGITMGQLLSIPMLLIGFWLWYRHPEKNINMPQ